MLKESACNQTLDDLNRELGKPGVSFQSGRNELATVRLEWEGNFSTIYLLGAQVTSWEGAESGEHIFLSRDSLFQPGKAIRGGIPLCYPQFAGLGPLPQHGFARTAIWKVIDSASGKEGVSVTLELDDHEGVLWPGMPTTARLSVQLNSTLSMEMTVTNHSAVVIEITHAFHTYFRVGNIDQVRIQGLNGNTYLDKVLNGETAVESRDLIQIEGETDRVYLNAPDAVEIKDLERQLVFRVEKTKQQDVVLWNPWTEKSLAMKDLGNDEYRRMVCLETGNIGAPVRIGGGASIVVSQRISVRKAAK